jgi:hypothetical protein
MDSDSKKCFPGWVVRPRGYVFGLKKWYQDVGIMPGSIITIYRAGVNGQVLINPNHRRSKEWFRTILVGADGGVVFALLKQQMNTQYDERMTVFIPDEEALDKVWTQKNLPSMEVTVLHVMQELIKLNPQGHVHAQELYAAVNIIRRCSPQVIFHILTQHPTVKHVGDLYYRLDS